ncbi:hypothetical protein NliqN6_3048 [Naganishia liquefaciens]|uniref:RING-type domain-containing protein n=1 Tax=Naganishia liquefaciens TaxID=104408 RepID=A0A8H3TTH7_9TREE|nr:hypothetical protein NliqN6_3048 [Naganishia liquefaciens]
MPGRNHVTHSYRPGRPIIDELNYADQPVFAIDPVPSRNASHRGHEQPSTGGNNARPHAARKASEAVNLNHLLNFSMPRRERDVPGSGHTPRRSRGARNTAHNKERYVNAQFRFVMKPTANYAAHLADPDLFYQWPQILQVIVPTVSALAVAQGDEPSSSGINNAPRRAEKEREGMTCPICLGDPVAPRMTKCGHIFCFPCILHYFQLSDIPKTAKCPICGDTIQERMLKSVRWADTTIHVPDDVGDHDHDAVVGDLELLDSGSRAASNSSAHKLTMRLMQRPQITTLALPRSSTWPSDAVPPMHAPWHFIPDVMTYAKFMLATSSYMVAELEHNVRALEQERVLMAGDELGQSFVDRALRHVRDQMDKARTEMDTPALKNMEREAREACAEASGRREPLRSSEPAKEVVVPDGREDEAHDSATSISLSPAKSKTRRRAPARAAYTSHDEPSYLYYQATTGANVFLHPLDIKILLAHYKSYTAFPNVITIRPEGADEGTINEELRRRCKYLAHLQMGTDVVFVEADLEDTLGPEAVAPFEQALKQRRNRRRERVKKDDKAKLKWEAQEREKMPFGARYAPPQASGDVDEDFLYALQRSTIEMGPPGTASTVGGSEVSSSPTTHDLGTSWPASSNTRISPAGVGLSVSPPMGGARSITAASAAHNKSFASALHAPPGTRSFTPKRDPKAEWEMEQAWSAFEASAMASASDAASVAAGGSGAEASGKGGKKVKAKKVVLSMSSGGRRA